MCACVQRGVQRNEQPSGSGVNNFFDQGNFEAMKTLSGWEAAHCDEHKFCANITVRANGLLNSCFNKIHKVFLYKCSRTVPSKDILHRVGCCKSLHCR